MTSTTTHTPLQPLLDNEVVILHAPSQAWSATEGGMGSNDIHGVYLGDVRVLSQLTLTVGDAIPAHIATVPVNASTVRFEHLLRQLDDRGSDPDVRCSVERTIGIEGMTERITLTSRLDRVVATKVRVELRPDASMMETIKSGLPSGPMPDVVRSGGRARWTGNDAHVVLNHGDAHVEGHPHGITVSWLVAVPAHGSVTVGFEITTHLDGAAVAGVTAAPRWKAVEPPPADFRMRRWLERALQDLSALRMTTADNPDEVFIAAGAPWFFTLFGRDSIWTARLLLPVDEDFTIARGTLRALARLQGRAHDRDSAEQPGKIMHELRAQTLSLSEEGLVLPPLYFGTVDATALWISLLHDAWQWGLPEDEVRELLPNLQAALQWMRDFGDSDGDGLLEYVDESGHGLSNQGWKDSADGVQWRNGELAAGPIALVEVQAYAYQAAISGAAILEHFQLDGSGWRRWAADLKARFNETFWLSDSEGAYLAIALDADKRAVDSVTSNPGHVLGTGLLTPEQAALVASRLVSPELSSGFGVRTMSTSASGYWPVSYHGGSVWTHDTAIAIVGLAREGHLDKAELLAEGLLAAAPAFDYRMPELHSGDAIEQLPRPVPYPAACRPQAWSAAAAVAIWATLHRDAAAGPTPH